MADVTIRELRYHGREVLDRVAAGERVTVTCNGRPVAELRPIPGRGLSAEELVRRWRRLRPIDPVSLRRDVDAVIDPSL